MGSNRRQGEFRRALLRDRQYQVKHIRRDGANITGAWAKKYLASLKLHFKIVGMYIPRLLEASLKQALKTFPAVVVTGPRQAGKSTLVQTVSGKRYAYVSLDELDIRSLAIHDPRGFLAKYPPPVIIDEIQHAPELLSYLKAMIDRDRKAGRWILTGSQAFPLMRNISESLAGRVAVMTLYPFALSEMNRNLRMTLKSAPEFIRHLNSAQKVSGKFLPCGRWLLRGGYPRVFVEPDISLKLWFSSYLQTYIDRDVRGNIKSANLNEFERFVKLLASRTAQELNYSSLAGDVGVTVPTIKSWVSFLEASALIYLLYPYHKNFGKRIIKSPKCYFMDTALVCYLVGLQDENHLLSSPMAGALFETACVTQFVKRFTAFLDPASLYFWRSIDGFEVDLLVEVSGKIFPIEFKLSSTITERHASSLQTWLKLTGQRSKEGLIVSTSEQTGLVGRHVQNCHYSVL
ncbi:MAG: ATP-binding protein [Candidatus Omnitrophica bacterium]|nr:ATP-binding protein [Candidatus Omnitrophota bacterium]